MKNRTLQIVIDFIYVPLFLFIVASWVNGLLPHSTSDSFTKVYFIMLFSLVLIGYVSRISHRSVLNDEDKSNKQDKK